MAQQQLENEEFIDADNYRQFSGQEAGSFKEIVLRQVNEIRKLYSQELTAGYVEKKMVGAAGSVFPTEKYHDDKREGYCNAVDVLYDLLLPECLEDDKFQKAFAILEKLEEKEFKECKEVNDLAERRDEWLKKKVPLRRKLFQQLSMLLWRNNYLSAGMYSE